MPVAIITGASRGLGLALADRSPTGLGPRHRRPRTPTHSPPRSRRSLPRTSVRAIAGDVADPAHRGRSWPPPPSSAAIDAVVNNASVARSVPAAARSPTTRSTCSRTSTTVNVVAPLALVQAALPRARGTGGTIVNITSDAAVEAYEGWGGYGSSKAALEQLGSVLGAEEPRRARVHVRPRRHAHADAPGRVPGRGHLRPARARDRRPRPASACSTATAERPLPGARTGRRRHDAPRAAGAPCHRPGALRAAAGAGSAEPPEARGITRDAVRMMVAYRPTGRSVHANFSRPAAVPRRRRSRRRQHVRDAGRRGRRRRRRTATPLGVHLSTAAARRTCGSSSCRPNGHGPNRGSRAARVGSCSLPGGGSRRAARAASSVDGRLWVASLAPARAAADLSSRCTAVRSATATCAADWPSRLYQNVYATEPGSAEMPSAGRPFTPEVITRLVAKGVGVAPLVLHTGVSSLEAHEAPVPRVLPGPDRTPPHLVNDTHRQGGRVIAIGTTVVRALETVVDERRPSCIPARAGPRP